MATVRNLACIAFRPEALDVHGLPIGQDLGKIHPCELGHQLSPTKRNKRPFEPFDTVKNAEKYCNL